MTPLATRMFRRSDEKTQRDLAASQFFECSALTSMAIEMRLSDEIESGFSSNARLPATKTVIEAMIRGTRIAFACQECEDDGRVSVNAITEQADGRVYSAWQAAFTPGTDQITFGSSVLPPDSRQNSIFIGLVMVEKFLCIINQPGLIDQKTRATDKRVVREAAAHNIETPPQWYQCHIRPGIHGTGSNGVSGREHKLHYVRKHLKPSLGTDRWVDGYWRGNSQLGIHLKSYVVHSPPAGANNSPSR